MATNWQVEDSRSFQEEVATLSLSSAPANWLGWSTPGFQVTEGGQGQVEYGVLMLSRDADQEFQALSGSDGPRRYVARFWLYAPTPAGSSVADEFVGHIDDGFDSWTFFPGPASDPVADDNGLFYQLIEASAWTSS